MDLRVRIPDSESLKCATARILARLAPAFHTERGGKTEACVAEFPNLPQYLDAAVRLVNEAVDIPNVQVTINGRPVLNLTKFLSALLCYRDSLGKQDKQAYCAERADRVSEAAGCPVWTCLARCPFMCSRCHQLTRESGAPSLQDQLREIAVKAEVEWCPNLRLPS